MTTGLIVIATVIVIATATVIWYLYDEYKTYQDRYEWYSGQYAKARHHIVKLEGKLKEAQQTKGKQTVTINVDSDAVVSKVMAKVNKDIEAIKERERIYIKVDGKEINTEKLKEIIRKERETNGKCF